MKSVWIEEGRLARALQRNEDFWDGTLEQGPLMWITSPEARPGRPPAEPATEEELWTDVEYVVAAAEHSLGRTHYAGDALPVHNPWLGPDQVAAWLGAPMQLRPRDNTSWVKPFVEDWDEHTALSIDPENRWWRLYLQLLQASVRSGRGRWVTAYPDLHTGIDALSAIRGPERLLIDLLERPASVRRAVGQMTELFRQIVDTVSAILLPAGQGTSNWTMGWSARRFLCIGQNDFTCMISPQMFDEFCLQDTAQTTRHVDRSIYHLDGPGAVRHLPRILGIEPLDCVQWIHGAGQPPASQWLPLLKSIQAAGKSVQVHYGGAHAGDADLEQELAILCRELDPDRLFFWAVVDDPERAERLVRLAADAGRRR